MKEYIVSMPVVGQVVRELIRCRDCKHYRYYGLSQDTVSECKLDICTNPDEDWFCAEGEKEAKLE